MTEYPELGERVWERILPNGLTVRVIPKPGFRKKMAYFAVDYGSVHRRFTVDGVEKELSPGIAHFLEHKMFDLPGRDVSAEFAAMGVSPNAFTGYDMTAYYFSGTENFYPALRLLLEFVSTPYFTAETVAKEQGIIGQEIVMNDDSADTRVFENLMGILYENHEIRTPILGTVESIAAITPEELYLCHRYFYRPDNMLLCVAGDVDPEQVAAIAAELTGECPEEKVTAVRSWKEAELPAKNKVRDKMEIAMPTFQLGFKCPAPGRGEPSVRTEMIGDLAAEALFGESSALYLDLYGKGLIDGSFGGGFETVEGMGMLTAGGDSSDPEQVRDAILKEAARLAKEGISPETLLRMKRSNMGRRIRRLDSFDSLCVRVCTYFFAGFDYFRFPRVLDSVTEEDVRRFLAENVLPQRCGISIVDPISR